MSNGLLPIDQMWVGVDENGSVVAASIEKERPRPTSMVFFGCKDIFKCGVPESKNIFGAKAATLEKLEE